MLTGESVSRMYANQNNYGKVERGSLYAKELKLSLAKECVGKTVKERRVIAKREGISFFTVQGFLREYKNGRLA